MLQRGRDKIATKKCDVVIANDIRPSDAGFSVSTNAATVIFADGTHHALPLMSKEALAVAIWDLITPRWNPLPTDPSAPS